MDESIYTEFSGGFEQRHGPADICIDENLRTENASVHMRLGCEINHGIEMPFMKQTLDERSVSDVAAIEVIMQIRLDIMQAFQVTGISELIKIHQLDITM